jgi:hypothetical protein
MWGFDLTTFNNDEDNYVEDEENSDNECVQKSGVVKFQELLDIFNLKFKKEDDLGVQWTNEDNSIILVTANNPITGKHVFRKDIEKGYLSSIGVSCKSTDDLQNVIDEIRTRATFIKEEANGREYI